MPPILKFNFILQNSAKLKVLGRSHAMREETSPPREPSPQACVSIITSPPASSPLTPSPSTICDTAQGPVTVNGSPAHVLINVSDESRPVPSSTSAVTNSSDTHMNASSPITPTSCVKIIDNNVKSEQNSYICDCISQICTKCSKVNERNINNNIRDNVNNNNVIVSSTHSSNMLSVNRANMRHKLRHQGSSQGSFEGSSSTSPCLSRGKLSMSPK